MSDPLKNLADGLIESADSLLYPDDAISSPTPELLTAGAEAIRRIPAAIDLIVWYGGVQGEHHKAWVLDQVVRVLAGDDYPRVVADAKTGADGPATYGWDCGVAP